MDWIYLLWRAFGAAALIVICFGVKSLWESWRENESK